MKSICLVSWKGGTGKTTLACNLAERAGAAGLNTTLCDFDPQFIASGIVN
jgi:cellulose biosynthesis protein BcsQ